VLPTGNVSPELCVESKDVTAMLSVAVGSLQVTTIPLGTSVSMVMSEGIPEITGGSVSVGGSVKVTVTVNDKSAEFPAASDAV
jgi:hypothetical protein